jgi:hypothetical protein
MQEAEPWIPKEALRALHDPQTDEEVLGEHPTHSGATNYIEHAR